MKFDYPDIFNRKFSGKLDSHDTRTGLRGHVRSWLVPHDKYEKMYINDYELDYNTPNYISSSPSRYYDNVNVILIG